MINPPLPGASIDHGPQDWQILQQDASGVAAIALAGAFRTEAPDFRVEARIVRETDGAPVTAALDWQPAVLLSDSRWELTLAGIPAGGLYRLETRVWRSRCPDTRPMRGDYVHHLGVGDIWVIAGQSNASGTGTGYAEDPPTLGIHQLGNDEEWRLATHPLEDATHTRHSVTVHGVFQAHSPWLAFGRRLMAQQNHPIALIPTALGGAPLSLWLPGASLYTNMLDMVSLAGGRVRGIVWYQGESDCSPGLRADYGARFGDFVAGVRRDLAAPDLPILTAQLGRYAPDTVTAEQHAESTALREAQRQAARTLPGVSLIPAVDLPMCDEIHVSVAGNLLLGERFAASALRDVYGRDIPDPGIHLREARWLGDEECVIRLSFERPRAGWCHVGPVEDFVVEDETGHLGVVACTLHDEGYVDLHLARTPLGRMVVHAHAGCCPVVSLRDRDQRPVFAFSVEVPS